MNPEMTTSGHIWTYNTTKNYWESLCGGHILRDFPAPDLVPDNKCLVVRQQIELTHPDQWPTMIWHQED